MLNITPKAHEVLRKLQEQPMRGHRSGLRIARRPARPDGPYGVAVTNAPREGDRIFDYDGARVFLGSHAVTALSDRLLDTRVDPTGRLEFVVRKDPA